MLPSVGLRALSGYKAAIHVESVAARLKPCPFKAHTDQRARADQPTMNLARPHRTQMIAPVWLCLGLAALAYAQDPPSGHTPLAKEKVVTSHATGTFEVKLTPQPDAGGADPGLDRMSIDKQFHGDLEGTSKGQMLSAMGSVKGSAGYVAMEQVTGMLKGRSGSFVLQHSGTMRRGEPQLSVTVVPDSGTGELAGLAGTFAITIDAGRHSYDFEYSLPAGP